MAVYFDLIQMELGKSFAGGIQFWLFLASLVYLWFAEKAWRKMVVVPSALLVIVLLNPLLYLYVWIRTIGHAFFRVLWALPVAIVIGLACVSLVRKCKKVWLQAILVVVLGILMMRSGPYMYIAEDNGAGVFTKAANAYHLPENVIEISEYLMAQEENPRVVCDIPYATWMRMVYPEIRLYAGRLAFNVRGKREKAMQAAFLEDPINFKWIRKRMIKRKYTYLVMASTTATPEEVCPYGFELLETFTASDKTAYVFKVSEK